MSTYWRLLAIGVLLLQPASATLIPRLSFEQLTDASDFIVSGRIVASWPAWDREHKYIWTHYNLSLAATVKGAPPPIVEFAEPGGMLDGRIMSIAGSVTYAVGDTMVLFLSRMPNGYLRTTGWAQGKYALDARGKLHGSATLEGIALTELGQRVSARIGTSQGKAK